MSRQGIRPSPQSSEIKPRFFYGYIVVAVAFISLMVIIGTHHSFGVFFKPLVTEFGWTRAITSGAFSLSAIMLGLFGTIMGWLTDKIGPRIVLSICGFLFGLGFILMSQVGTVWQLYLFYGVIIGIGRSGVWVPLASTVAKWFAARRSLMTGVIMAGMSVGGLIIPLVASWLILTYQWRTSYLILGVVVLPIVISAAQFLRRDPTQMGQVPYHHNESEGTSSKLETKSLSLSEALYTKQFWMAFGIEFSLGLCGYSIMIHIVPHAIDLGISAVNAASILATISCLGIVGQIVLGVAGDRIGNRQVFIICFILMSAALLWLTPAIEMWKLYLFAAIFGFAFGGAGVSESPLAAMLFGLRSHGLIYGVLNFGFTIGASIGPFLAGYIFDITNSYQIAFIGCAGIAIFGAILATVLKPSRS
ncbi:L-lactate transporter [subsurface metagenome]